MLLVWVWKNPQNKQLSSWHLVVETYFRRSASNMSLSRRNESSGRRSVNFVPSTIDDEESELVDDGQHDPTILLPQTRTKDCSLSKQQHAPNHGHHHHHHRDRNHRQLVQRVPNRCSNANFQIASPYSVIKERPMTPNSYLIEKVKPLSREIRGRAEREVSRWFCFFTQKLDVVRLNEAVTIKNVLVYLRWIAGNKKSWRKPCLEVMTRPALWIKEVHKIPVNRRLYSYKRLPKWAQLNDYIMNGYNW